MNEIKLDDSLVTSEERVVNVEQIIANTPPEKLTPAYLEFLGTFILKQETKKEKLNKNQILTKNRMSTINDNETSFEGLISKLENGEDGIYNMIANDKNMILHPKQPITEADIAEIPALQNLVNDIKATERRLERLKNEGRAKSKEASRLWTQLIEMRRDQYVIKGCYKSPYRSMHLIKSFSKINLEDRISINEETGEVRNDGYISFFDPKHISALLCNYAKLKEDAWELLGSDAKWLMEDFDALVDSTLKDNYPLYYSLVIYKIDGKQNTEIQALLEKEFGIKHSVEYISSLWRNKIPKLIAETAVNEYLTWYYTNIKPGKWKKCSRCGQVKLAHNNFFSKNKTSKDGFYSICKDCRNKK